MMKTSNESFTNAAALFGYADGGYTTNEALIAAANSGEADALRAMETFAARLADGCAYCFNAAFGFWFPLLAIMPGCSARRRAQSHNRCSTASRSTEKVRHADADLECP